MHRCMSFKNIAPKPKHVSRLDFFNMWIMFQFSNDTSLFARLLLISRGVKFSFNPGNDFFFIYDSDRARYTGIFFYVHSREKFQLISLNVDFYCWRCLHAWGIFCNENFAFVLFVLVLPWALDNFKHSKFKYCAVKITVYGMLERSEVLVFEHYLWMRL